MNRRGPAARTEWRGPSRGLDQPRSWRSRGSFAAVAFDNVAQGIIDAVEYLGVELDASGSHIRRHLLGLRRADQGRGDVGVLQHPRYGQLSHGQPGIAGD